MHFRDNINENFFEEIYMKLRPLADRVLAKPEKAETKTASGIIIPDAAQEKTQTAVIEAVGPGTDKEKITVKLTPVNSQIRWSFVFGTVLAPLALFFAILSTY